MRANVIKAIAVAAELTGAELSEAAVRVMEADLAAYPEPVVLAALDRCRRELKGRLTLGAVMERLAGADGRPGADEAWAISLAAEDEAQTVVWTEEMAQAFAVARPLLDERDKVGARMAFKGAYERLLAEAREAQRPARWSASLGWDVEGRRQALEKAQAQGLLAAPAVAALMPPSRDLGVLGVLVGAPVPALPNNTEEARDAKDVLARCKAMLAGRAQSAEAA